jgi:hypothetical protein
MGMGKKAQGTFADDFTLKFKPLGPSQTLPTATLEAPFGNPI